MLESTSIVIRHLFDSVHCELIAKNDPRYQDNDLIVWQVTEHFIVKLKTDGYLYYQSTDSNNCQYLYNVKELNELINYFL